MSKKTIIEPEEFFDRLKHKKMIYLDSLKFTLKKHCLDTKGRKKDLIERLYIHYNNEYYLKNIDKIILLQNQFRKILPLLSIRKKLECINEEDFYTLEKLCNIDKDFLFYFVDKDKYKYGFDIRSFKKLVENDCVNPYNRNKIPQTAIEKMNKQFDYLKSKKKIKKEKKEKLTEEQIFKNKLVNVFQKMDMMNVSAGGVPLHWFTNLYFSQLKNLYRILEDIWNYRAELTLQKKKDIVPNNDVFKMNMSHILNLPITKKRYLENIILNEIDKLISSSPNETHRNTGCYYVLIAFTEVSPECAIAMPWLAQY